MPCHPFLPIETSKSDPTHHQTRPIPIANYSYCYNHRSPPPPSAPAPSPIILPPRRASLHFDRLPSSSVHCRRQRVAAARLDSTPLDPTTVQGSGFEFGRHCSIQLTTTVLGTDMIMKLFTFR